MSYRIVLPLNSLLMLSGMFPKDLIINRLRTQSSITMTSRKIPANEPWITVTRSVVTHISIDYSRLLEKINKKKTKVVYDGKPRTLDYFLDVARRYAKFYDLPIEQLEICLERVKHYYGEPKKVVEVLSFNKQLISEKKLKEILVPDGTMPMLHLKELHREMKKQMLEWLRKMEDVDKETLSKLANKVKSSILVSNPINDLNEAKSIRNILGYGTIISEAEYSRLVRDFVVSRKYG